MGSRAATSATAVFAIMLWGITVAAPSLRAQDAAADDKRPAVQSLTDESLGKSLENLGYEPKKLGKGYAIAIKRDPWTFHMQLLLSPDGTKLGIVANLGTVENPDSVTAEQWKKLLIANGQIDPSFFYLDKTSNRLYLHRALDNRAVEPAFLRKQIENVCDNIKETADLWKLGK